MGEGEESTFFYISGFGHRDWTEAKKVAELIAPPLLPPNSSFDHFPRSFFWGGGGGREDVALEMDQGEEEE